VDTLTASLRAISLSSDDDAVLREERFFVEADGAHENLAVRRTVAILDGPKGDPQMRFDPLYTGAANDEDNAATAALESLHQKLKTAAITTVLRAGDLLIIDNRRVAHARTPFNARYDGSDRWLQRLGVWETHGGPREWLVADTPR
jgi:L-asparagine oxygenase